MTTSTSPAATDRGLWCALLGAAAMALYGFNDRVVLYHDEIINTYKASEGIVFDSARRPAYYFLNWLATKFFGVDVESLMLLSVVLFVATAIVLYRTGRSFADPLTALVGVGTFIASSTVLEHGIRGMPHVASALALSFCLYLAVQAEVTREERHQRWYFLGAGVAAVLALATHTTMAGLLLGLALWSGIRWLRRRRPAPLWGLGGLAGGGLLLVGLFDIANGGQGYLATLRSAVFRVQEAEPVSERYLQPWSFYLQGLGEDFGVLVPLLAAGLLVAAALVVGKREKPQRPTGTILVLLLSLTGVSVGLLSVIRWKFERVIAGQIPLFALLVTAGCAWGLERFRGLPLRGLPRRGGMTVDRVLSVLLVLVVGGLAVAAAGRMDRRWESIADRKRHLYTTFYETLKHLPRSEEIVHVGGGAHRNRVRRFVIAAGRGWEDWGAPPLPTAELERRLAEEEVGYLITQPLDGKVRWFGADGDFAWVRLRPLYDYRGYAQLWQVEALPFDSALEDAFRELPRRTPIGVFGLPGQIPEGTSDRLAHAIEDHNLRDYRLTLERTVERQFYFLGRNSIEYALLPAPEWLPEYGDLLLALEQAFGERGGEVLARSGDGSLALWKLGEAER